MRSLRLFFFLFFIPLAVMGCGNSNNTDFVATQGATGNTSQPAAQTGTLVFSFAQAQTLVPEGTTRLRFDFFDEQGQLVSSEDRDFAAQIVFEEVPTDVVRVEITSLSENGFVLGTAETEVEVVPGESQQVGTVEIQVVTLVAVSVSPDPVLLNEGATDSLTLQGQFSDGSVFALDTQNAAFSSNNESVATVDASGVVTGVAGGSTTVDVSYTIPGTTNSVNADPVTVNVVANVTLDSLSVTPNPVDLQAGDDVQLVVEAVFSDSSTQALDESTLSYTGFNASVATVSASGLVDGVAEGTTSFTVTYTPPGGGTQVSSGAVPVNITPPNLTSLNVTPDPICIGTGGSEQLVIEGTFSDGSMQTLDASAATYTGHDTGVVTISNGAITPVAAGSTTVTVGFVDPVSSNTINSSPVSIDVSGPAVALSGANTFDTDSGQLNGSVAAGWDGSVLRVASFDLQSGGTLDISGSAPFQVEACGDVTVAGTITAAGQDGGNASGATPGTGGAAGPGGFAGGDGGGTDNNGRQGSDGSGPGAGGGGLTLGLVFSGGVFVGEVENGGGGAGHSVAGEAGFSGGSTGTPGPAGSSYVSIPTMLRGGSGGGGGSAFVDAVGTTSGGGGGGGGGGVVSLISEGVLTVSGLIDCSGGDGGDKGAANAGAGGGGGSGGSIQLLAPSAPSVSGTLNVTGGARGNGVADGGAGAAGRTNVGTL